MNICPCCKRKMPSPRVVGKSPSEKMLAEDIGKAERAILACQSALAWQDEHVSFYLAVSEEMNRLRNAIDDSRLLWSIYRRTSKHPSYATFEKPVEVAA